MLIEEDLLTEAQMPLQERVVDKLADIMFASDMILDMLRNDRLLAAHRLPKVEATVKGIYDQVDALMRGLTD
jgi:hypothetical protein